MMGKAGNVWVSVDVEAPALSVWVQTDLDLL